MTETSQTADPQPGLIIVGIGNGGGNTVHTMARQWPEAPRVVAVNTDIRSLSELKAVECVAIGERILKGMGTGGDPRLARQAAESDIDVLRSLFKNIDLAIFATGLGGGTGSGVTPILINEAKKAGALTLCFAMLPFDFEGAQRKEHAARGLQAIRDLADGVICLPNQRLLAMMDNKANIQESFRRAEIMLATGIQEFWRILNRSAMINFDFADLRAFLQNSNGNCVFCCSEGSGENRIDAVLEGIKKNIVLNNCQALADADSFVICIIGGADLPITDIDGIVKGILALGRKNALVMTGVGYEPDWREKVHVTILAAEKEHLPSSGAAPEHARHESGSKTRKEHGESARTDMIQAGLFDTVEQGRFKGINPTIVDGNNLDIPTYIRRRIPIQKAKITNN